MKCVTCLKGFTVKHTFFVLPVSKIDEHTATPFAFELKDLPFGSKGFQHVFTSGAEKHTVNLEEVFILLKSVVSVVELVILLMLRSLLLFELFSKV